MNDETTITVPTIHGLAEATKSRSEDFWHIGYPWGDDRFAGSRKQVRTRMRKEAADMAKQEAEDEATQ